MLTNEYTQRKQEIQNKIKAEETRFRYNPAELYHTRRNIRALNDELRQLELKYSRTQTG
jgi:hypothetical protein